MNDLKTSPEQEGPMVSVVIPTRNRSAMLNRAIRSVLAQTYGDFEIIVVADNSTDDTAAMIDGIKDPRVRFFQHESRKGASAARNTGMKNARGKYIAFLDDDDEWTPDKLAVQIPMIEKAGPDVGLVYAWMKYVRNGKSVSVYAPRLRGNVFLKMLEQQSIGNSSTVIIRHEVVDKVGFFDEDLFRGNDGDYWRRISKHYNVIYAPRVLALIHLDADDRISLQTRDNLRNAIASKKKRLSTFQDDFADNPDIHCRFLLQLAVINLRILNLKEAISWGRKASAVAPGRSFFMSSAAHALIDNLCPAFVKNVMKSFFRGVVWRMQILVRALREWFARFDNEKTKHAGNRIAVVYMTGMPRTGSSLMKNFLGSHSELEVQPFQPDGFFVSWRKSFHAKKILVDKSTHYIRALNRIWPATGENAVFCCVVRDPRDQLVSLFESERHPEISRGMRFWKQWAGQYEGLLKFAERNSNARCFLVRYEDLVGHPVQAKQAFLTWLGVNFNAGAITSDYIISHEKDDQDPNVGTTNRITNKSVGRCREVDNPVWRGIIDGYHNIPRALALMKVFGFGEDGIGKLQNPGIHNLKIFEPVQ